MSERLVGATTDLLTVVQDKFLPNSEKFMYQFNLRELCNIMQVRCSRRHWLIRGGWGQQ